MSIPQLGYKFIRPLYSTERPGAVGGRVGAELSASGSLSSVLSSMYGAPFANTHGYSAFLPYSSDLSILNQLGSQYEFKDSPGVQHAGFPHAAFYPYGHQYHFEDPSRPKNATRESTSTLKAWLSEHRKNPYPTKGEKIMLAIITKMTLTQVSTWFANARRRLKKENKMTWTPRNRSEDEDEEDSIDLEKNDDDDEPLKRVESTEMSKDSVGDDCSGKQDDATDRVIIDCEEQENRTDSPVPTTSSPRKQISDSPKPLSENCIAASVIHSANPTPKPKLWSLAEIATSDKGCDEPSQTFGALSPPRSPAQCPFPPRHFYYASPFYPAFTNYGTYGHLNATQSNGINTAVLQRARDGKVTLDVCEELSFDKKRANI